MATISIFFARTSQIGPPARYAQFCQKPLIATLAIKSPLLNPGEYPGQTPKKQLLLIKGYNENQAQAYWFIAI